MRDRPWENREYRWRPRKKDGIRLVNSQEEDYEPTGYEAMQAFEKRVGFDPEPRAESDLLEVERQGRERRRMYRRDTAAMPHQKPGQSDRSYEEELMYWTAVHLKKVPHQG